ncbi:MAG: prohibitin family protein [Oscillospiraceae bacterium]|nr:prohibitin family protein [Oscillospiraceae bacterium]
MADIRFSTGQNAPPNIDGKKAGRTALLIAILVAALVLIFNSFVIVQEGYVGVKYRLGKIVTVDTEAGLKIKIPFIEEYRMVDKREQVYEFRGDAFTRDSQPVNELYLKATYRYQQDRIEEIIRDVGIEFVQDKYFVPNVQRIAKDIIGRYEAERLVQSRFEVQQQIEEELYAWLIERGVILTSFAIENINFEAKFLEAVENKVVAEQDVARMRHQTEERRIEAEQIEIAAKAEAFRITTEAEAEAAAIALIQAQIAQNVNYIEYLKIVNWNGVLPMVIGDGVNPFVVLGANDNAPTVTAPSNTAPVYMPQYD